MLYVIMLRMQTFACICVILLNVCDNIFYSLQPNVYVNVLLPAQMYLCVNLSIDQHVCVCASA